MYLDLERIKKHLNIDESFTDDDNYLMSLYDVAEATVQQHIDNRLDEICLANGGNLPSPLAQAILLMIGNLYANRESVSYSSAIEVPLSYGYLCDLYKNYGINEGNV